MSLTFFAFFFFVFQAVSLDENKKRIFEYVESRMTFIAPNLSIMVGASVAAKLMGQCTLSRTLSEQSGLSHQSYFFLFKFVLKKKKNRKSSTVKVSYFNYCLKHLEEKTYLKSSTVKESYFHYCLKHLEEKTYLKSSTVKVSYFHYCLKQPVRLSLSPRGKNPVIQFGYVMF